MRDLQGEFQGFELVAENYVKDRTGESYAIIGEGGGIMGMWSVEEVNGGILPRDLRKGVRIAKLGLGGEMRSTVPFSPGDVSVSTRGGLDSALVAWEGGVGGGVCCYRDLTSGDLVIVPHFRVLNQTGKVLSIEESKTSTKQTVEDGGDVVINESALGLIMTLKIEGVGTAGPARVKGIGTVIIQVKGDDGMVVGAVRIDTFSGGEHARVVGRVTMWRRGKGVGGGGGRDVVKMRVKLKGGEFRFNGRVKAAKNREEEKRKGRNLEGAFDLFSLPSSQPRIEAPAPPDAPEGVNGGGVRRKDIMTVEVTGVSVEYTRVFKKGREGGGGEESLGWDAKSKLLLVVGSLQVLDENPKSEYRHVIHPLTR